MQRHHRLTASARITGVHREGRSVANNFLVLRLSPNDLGHSRFCFVASKRVGNAVARNRVKRRLREAVRNTDFQPGWDAVIMARKGAAGATYAQLERAVRNLMRRTSLTAPESPK